MESLLPDYHLHTNLSRDGKEHVEKFIRKAIILGMKSICITDHQDYDYTRKKFPLDFKMYFREIEECKKKFDKIIDVRVGVEMGLEVNLEDQIKENILNIPFDFVIGSSHMVNGEDPFYPEFFLNKNENQCFEEYFKNINTNIDIYDNFDVYGHLDYIIRYAPEKQKNFSYKLLSDIIDEILSKLVKKGKGLEVNTSGWRYGLPFFHPQPQILKRYRALGGEIITIGSDAHYAKHLGYKFAVAREILKNIGFKYYSVYRKRIPEFIGL
ncbi:Histidinol-phosphatase [Sporomusa rhizae]|uniref:histidinol-phosphatase HisJ family protein n=1 Tax=Sporomusa rhizae TaxID=357999 RepID=UPI00352BAD9C